MVSPYTAINDGHIGMSMSSRQRQYLLTKILCSTEANFIHLLEGRNLLIFKTLTIMGAKKQAIKDMSEEGMHTSVIYMEKALLEFTAENQENEE